MSWLKENLLTVTIVLVSSTSLFFVNKHFSNKKFTRMQDWLIEGFGLVFTLFICSIALSLAFGIMLLVADIFYSLGNWFTTLSLLVKIPISIISGIFLTILLYKVRNNGQAKI